MRTRLKAVLLTCSALSLFFVVIAPPVTGQNVPTCAGKPATIIGTDGPDLLFGTARADVIVAKGGDDRIFALGGDDTICGNAGADNIQGGDGADLIIGGYGNDRLIGSNGNDDIRGGVGDDYISGKAGADTIRGDLGADRIAGNLGIAKDAPQRVEAGVLYVLEQLTDEGHTCFPVDELAMRAVEILNVEGEAVETAINVQQQLGRLVIEEISGQPSAYLERLHDQEVAVAEGLRRLARATSDLEDVDLAAFYSVDYTQAQELRRLEAAGGHGGYRLKIARDRMVSAAPQRLRGVIVADSGWGNEGAALELEIPMLSRPR